MPASDPDDDTSAPRHGGPGLGHYVLVGVIPVLSAIAAFVGALWAAHIGAVAQLDASQRSFLYGQRQAAYTTIYNDEQATETAFDDQQGILQPSDLSTYKKREGEVSVALAKMTTDLGAL